jgi:hypothetical protein
MVIVVKAGTNSIIPYTGLTSRLFAKDITLACTEGERTFPNSTTMAESPIGYNLK